MTSTKLLDELAALGYEVSSIDELRESGLRYVDAVPAILAALAESEDIDEKEWLVRALSYPWAKALALGPVIDEFRALPLDGERRTNSVRWAFGNALEVLWDDSRFDDLVNIVQDKRYGRARQMVVLGMKKSKRPEVGKILVGLLDDPEVNGHAVDALVKLKVPEARPGLERLTTDERAWVRKAAVRALSKLE